MNGIKETKELLIGLNELSILLLSVLKDGAQISDVPAVIGKLMADEELKSALAEAIKGINAIPEELKNISLVEGMELVQAQMLMIPKFLEALKK